MKRAWIVLFLLAGALAMAAPGKKWKNKESLLMDETMQALVLPGSFQSLEALPGKWVPVLPDFTYNGEPFSVEKWAHEKAVSSNEPYGRRLVYKFTSPDRLATVLVTLRVYRDYPAVEVRPELLADAGKETGIFADVLSLKTDFVTASPEIKIRAIVGSQQKPDDFSARTFCLVNREGQRACKFATPEGRSSAEWMPYFGVDFDARHGLEFAVGWSGWWQTAFLRSAETVQIAAGLGRSHFKMLPGERFQLPTILLFYRNDVGVQEFQSTIRDFMIQYKAPRDGKGNVIPPLLPITASGGNRPPALMHKIIDYAAQNKLPFDTFWIDAGGWGPPHQPDMTKNCGDCWGKYAGWWTVNPTVHPDGNFKKIADAANAAGMKLLLWFEPERVSENAPILKEHPEYVYPADIYWKFADSRQRLLDLGNPAARRWVFDLVCKNIEESRVGVYRQDMNIAPEPFWQSADAPDRVGAAEIRHVNGLYTFWDMLRKRYPDMLLENCASGGRRLDYEAMSRCHAYCRSDYFVVRRESWHDNQILQGQNANLNTLAWIPFQGNEADPARMFDDYDMFSLAGTGLVFTPFDWEGGICKREFSAEETAWFKKSFGAIDRMRKILTGHFRPLTPPASLDTTCWTAWQGHDPARKQGFILAFRREDALEECRTFTPGWIDPAARYEIEDYQDGKKREIAGKELAHCTVNLAPRSFRLIFYRELRPSVK